ncbi:MAG TPA: site-specific integrase [Terriglobales bacterium]|nr:site-specific integrase [Terriglobales bacterium]
MNQTKRRLTYQYGTLVLEKRNRGPNVWAYRYFEIENGKKRRRKSVVGTQEEYPTRSAAERAAEHLRLSANAEINNHECPTMRGLIDRYIDQVLRPCLAIPVGGAQDGAAPISYHCAMSYKLALNNWVRPRWETYRVREFEKPAVRAAVEEWLRSLWRSSKNPKGLAPKTVRAIWSVMKLTFKFGVKWGYLNENPMGEKRVELPRGSTKRTTHSVQLTAPQFFRLLDLLDSREKLAVAFAGWLGPRVSEIFGLQWQDLDLKNGTVSFRRGFVQGRITPLKTEASRTNLPMPDELVDLLRQWQSVTPFDKADDWVFASPYTKGKRPFWPAQLLKKHIKPTALAAGLPSIGWHSFRHTVSAWGKEAGLKLEDVKTLLRHEDIATTSNVYGDLGMDAKRRIQQRLVAFVNEQANAADAAKEASRIERAWGARMPESVQ